MLRKVISLAVFSLVLFNSQLMLSANDDLNQNDQEEQLANEDMVEETSNEDNDLEQTDENQESDTKTEEYDEEQQTEKVDEESNNETVDEKEVNKEVIEENNEESSKKVSVEKQGDLETTEKINEEEEPQVFSKGDRSPQIIEFKEQLNAIGFGYITVNELFGSFTEKQVKKFQEYYGLEVNGQLDLPTQQLINDIHSNSLQQGHSDQQLIELKTKMNRLGYGNILVTTYFGNFTEKKLKEFQSDYGLISNGIFDSKTLEELNTVYNTGFSVGARHKGIPALKNKLDHAGFGGMLITDYFGDYTKTQVEDFQAYYGLEVTGTITEDTFDKLDELENHPLQQGKSHEDLPRLKQQLNRLGYGNILETDYFGDFSEKKVKEFQKDYGLAENGIIEAKTKEQINEVYNSGFSVGARHKGIPGLKRKLDHAGFGGMLITDYYGNYTKTRVEDFQAYYGLDVTGSITEETFEKVEELYNHPLQYDKRHSALPGIKEQLNRIGFGNILVTNYFGAFSEKKVKEFQRAYSLVDHGIVDDKTREQLDAITNSPFQKGKRHKDTSEFKVMLNRLGFGYITVTDYFGDFSEKKVKDFQRTYDLVEHGIIDSITQEKLESIYHSPFQKGKRHEDLPELKRKLNKLGFGNIKVTNYFGDFSEKKVKQFQRYFGLPDHGIIDDKTLEKLNEIYNSPMQKGKRHKDIIELKENLNSLGYGNILVTNYYGDFTEKKVKEFQKDYGLPVSGIADYKTVEEIESRIIKVFIDPGHGGHDPGGTGYGLEEKNVALDIALSAVKYLNQIKGVRVNISRNDDTFVVLEDRSKMANEWGADYFISVHNNAFMGVGKGFESYVHTTASKTEKQIQSVLHEHLISKIGGVDRGQHEANFNVLRNTNMPAILLEYLFIDNYEENQKLRQASYRDWLGKITADAFKKAIPLID
ncbi:peptidoglycan-binding protein [Gracilibacillus dipsosauri]|uniref:peptidoglycan-binding protein n=1 Tax=Gracilibacillus dipsosauri TaxID=178340 RepID=UPI0024099121